MTEVTHLPRLSPAAKRMRRYRERPQRGLSCIKVQLRRSEVDASDFQQAQSANGEPQFLQIVAEPETATRGESKGPKLTRVAFRVSRLMEFCTKRELQNQTGHPVDDWPLVVLKEVMDNALDAAEESEVAPVISIAVTTGSITIQDNGGGIETDTIESILDYTIRVSSREAYISPTRGAQGNAMKTILAMGYVLDREREDEDSINDDAVGVTFIETCGAKHRIEFRADHVTHQPKISHTTTRSPINVGTKITIKWPTRGLLEWAEQRFKQLAESYVWFNPHLSLRGVWFGREFINVKATNSNWEKWRPRNPTSPRTTNHSCSAISAPMLPGIATSDSTTRCGNSLASFAGSPAPLFSTGYWPR